MRGLWRRTDLSLVFAFLLLSALGLVAVASATKWDWRDRSTWTTVEHQAAWVAIGLGLMVLAAWVDYRALRRWAWALYGGGLALLVGVLAFGVTARGAARWIDVGPFTLQPAEFEKVALVVALAAYYAERPALFRSWLGLAQAAVWVVPPACLVLLQPDLGSTLVLVATAAGLWYLAGLSGWRLLALLSGGLGAATVLIYGYLHGIIPQSWIPFLHEYQVKRLLVFLNPGADRLGAGYHVWQSKLAIGSGGLTGQGLFNGVLNQYDYLPESQTDFIFAVVGEDMGFVGAALVVLLELFLVWRALAASARARDRFGSLVAGGVAVMLSVQLAVNVGMTVGLMPVTGVPLPFVSYGGSALLAGALALGVVLSVGNRRDESPFA
ncbi:MAG: rod shape-determining protein RodA [Clostridia bacterium]|nr:rod shape-determining protein RodA [Clostridia bacterium]